MEVRIIGLAPMVEVRGELGELQGFRPVFWLYYPELRQLLAWWTAVEGPDGTRTSYETIFDQRRFRGSIVKVSNVAGVPISDTRGGFDALLQSAALQQQLLDLGFDLWHY